MGNLRNNWNWGEYFKSITYSYLYNRILFEIHILRDYVKASVFFLGICIIIKT